MSDLLQEVDEIMRRERMAALWKDYGGYLIAFIIATIIMTGIISGYKSWNLRVQEEQTATLMTLQASADYPQNILVAENLDLRPGLRGIALISAAGKLIDLDRSEDAKALYGRAAADEKIPNDLRALAVLMQIRLSDDAQTPEEAEKHLAQLASIWNDKKSPWAAHARIEAAIITAHALGNYAGAREHLNAVQDTPDLPETLYLRARALDHVYALKQKAAAPATNMDSKS